MQLQFRVSKSPEQVFSVLSDMQKFVSVHPVISQALPLGDSVFNIQETLHFARIPFRFRYRAQLIASQTEQRVIMTARVLYLVNIHIRFDITLESGRTLILEEVNFKSILPVHYFLKRIFSEQHGKLFAAIEKLEIN